MADISIKNEDSITDPPNPVTGTINAGVAVELQGAQITYSFNNFIKVPDVPSVFLSTEAQVVVDTVGNTNPTIIIRGIIDVNNSAPNAITVALLKLFAAASGNDDATTRRAGVWIKEDDIFPTFTKIQIKSFSLDKRKQGDQNEGRIDYSINAVETL